MRPCTWNVESEPWPIQQRGWAPQEDLRSIRTLSYSKCGMVWQCLKHNIDEGGRITWPTMKTDKAGIQEVLHKGESSLSARMLWSTQRLVEEMSVKIGLTMPSPREHPYQGWMIVVHQYTSRNLTEEVDMLPGIAGLASEFARQTRDMYCAGLWRKVLLFELMWSLDPMAQSRNQPAVTTAPAEYRAPSWSWASINEGAIRMEHPLWYLCLEREVYERATVIGLRLEPLASSEPFGQLKAGHLILQGKFYHVGNFLESGSTTASGPLPAAQKVLQASILVTPGMKPEFRQQHKPCDRQHFGLLQLMAYSRPGEGSIVHYLVLESAAPDASVYRRIGLITLAANPGSTGYFSEVSRDDPLAFTGDGSADLAKGAFQELQKATVMKKDVKII